MKNYTVGFDKICEGLWKMPFCDYAIALVKIREVERENIEWSETREIDGVKYAIGKREGKNGT